MLCPSRLLGGVKGAAGGIESLGGAGNSSLGVVDQPEPGISVGPCGAGNLGEYGRGEYGNCPGINGPLIGEAEFIRAGYRVGEYGL